MATNRQIRISITSALNAAGIEATKRQVNTMARHLKSTMGDASKSMVNGWADFAAAGKMAIGAVTKAWGVFKSMIGSAFKFETQTNQFKTLIGDIDEAKAHMQDLKALGDTPPFSLDEFAKASRELMVMSDGILGYKKSLEMIGDAAAATGRPLETVSHAVGRLYAAIRDGQPVARAAMELKNMGILAPAVVQSLDDMQTAGKSVAEIWDAVEQSLAKYNGAMAETEQTGEGLMAAISTRWDNIVRSFGMAFQDTTKDGVRELSDALKELEESGTVERWASAAGAALGGLVKSIQWVSNGIEGIYNHLKSGRDFWNNKEEPEVDDSHDWVMTREAQVNDYTTKRYFRNRWDDSEKVEEIVDEALEKEFKQREAEEKRIAALREREESELARKRQALADAQAKIDERNALQTAQKKAQAEAEAAERLRREEEREAERMLRDQERLARQMTSETTVAQESSPSFGPHFGGRGDTPTSDYRQNEAQISDLLARRQAYIRERYQEQQTRWQERWDSGVIDRRGMLPTDSWNRAVQEGTDQFRARLEALQERRQWLEHQYANGMQTETSAQERTATACEKILSHFETGRF